jgi:hypothetical protein
VRQTAGFWRYISAKKRGSQRLFLAELREQFLPLSSSAPAVYWLGCLCSFEDWVLLELLEERLLELVWLVYWLGCLFSVLFLQLFVRFSIINGSFQVRVKL